MSIGQPQLGGEPLSLASVWRWVRNLVNTPRLQIGAAGLTLVVFAAAVAVNVPDIEKTMGWAQPAPRHQADHHVAKALVAAAATPAVAPQIFEILTPEQAVMLNAELPISTLPKPAAAPFVLPEMSPVDHARALTCLTMAVYYEAANQGVDGEAAVAQVVLNRLRNPLFPKSICGVVFEGSSLPTGCQFSFTCDGSLSRKPSADGWRQATAVAVRALGGYVQKDVGEATHYHTIWVVPYWQPSVVKIAQLGAHIFYRWDGTLGQPDAFKAKYAGSEIETALPPGVDLADLLPKPKMIAQTAPPPVVTVAATAAIQAPTVEAAAVIKPVEFAPPVAPLPPVSQGYFSQAAPRRAHLPM
jgi:spore germination cell wall hydrolase CwlJ-like protein